MKYVLLTLLLFVPSIVHAEELDWNPIDNPAYRCTFIEGTYNEPTRTFTIRSTTNIQLFHITSSSGRTTRPRVNGRVVTFTMDIPDRKNFSVRYKLVDQCSVWESGMSTAKPQK